MTLRLSPLAAAISSALFFSTGAWADGGEHVNTPPYPIAQTSIGAPGVNGADASGSSSQERSDFTITHSNETLAGPMGGNAPYAQGNGGGLGGSGGGSVFGGVSLGGSSGEGTQQANGGDAGATSRNTLTLDTVITNGAAGGMGGNGSASGPGGLGGGSVIGGFNLGGGGGSALGSSANGGNGAAAISNAINVINSTLNGAAGGVAAGGLGFGGGGGVGGAGGASVIGGLSLGGGGGSSLVTSTADGQANGGAGGEVGSNALEIRGSTLNGAQANGGTGGSGSGGTNAPLQLLGGGGGGAGGLGGGSALGGVSLGGAGGDSQTVVDSSSAQANGGAGGAANGNQITVEDSELLGGAGGDGVVLNDSSGGTGNGGAGGGSVIGAISAGGAGGQAAETFVVSASSMGGAGGLIENTIITLSNTTLTGAKGGNAADQSASGVQNPALGGGVGHAGAGGGSVFAGLSIGGAGGHSRPNGSPVISAAPQTGVSTTSQGGLGGNIQGNRLSLTEVTLNGADGGTGGSAVQYDSAGTGGLGGGSISGGVSLGGTGGSSVTALLAPTDRVISAQGGNAGDVTGNTIELTNVNLNGADGGVGGSSATGNLGGVNGAGGDGGAGGGSVFGGYSAAGNGGYSAGTVQGAYFPTFSASGGDGGSVTGNSLTLTEVIIKGGDGGAGGNASSAAGLGAAGGSGGIGGGSVIGGVSLAGNGGTTLANYDNGPQGQPPTMLADGGQGGAVTGNSLRLNSVTLTAGAGGAAGLAGSAYSSAGASGLGGGAVLGGYSRGGAAGLINLADANGIEPESQAAGSGGNGGDVTGNAVTLSGSTVLASNVYGGFSQGGASGDANKAGLGGLVENNSVTLIGEQLKITGMVFGGYSVDGNGNADHSRATAGNTLNLKGYRGSVGGVYNIEKFNWVLPKNVVNGDTLLRISGPDNVQLAGTQHTVAMESDGNRLKVGDEVVLIDKATGTAATTRASVKQGFFLIYDANLAVNADDEFVLAINNLTEESPRDLPFFAGRLNPSAKALLEGRAAALAFVNQGADMVSNQLNSCQTGFFFEGEGGRSQYKTGSHVKVNDFNLLLGGRSCFALPDASQMALALFAEHGNGNYDSRNSFEGLGKVSGHGDLRYTGAGVAMHVDVADTGTGVQAAPVLGTKNGVYVDAAVRAGSVKSDFASNDLVDAAGNRAQYNAKSTYASASAGVGYAWNLDAQQQVELYSRYTWSRIGSDKVSVGADKLSLGADTSSRLRVGTRYNYAFTERLLPYAGVAYEYDFDGRVSGKAYDLSIDKPELKGGSGVLEFGITTVPVAAEPGLKVDLGVQGFAGQRKGASGSLSLVYEF